jgi:DNA-binding response OmpR family regulator
MIGLRTPAVVALVESEDLERLQLRSRLEQWGYTPMVFPGASELLAALGDGKRFDLLLLVAEDFPTWNCLSAVSRVLGIPTFLLTDALDWTSQVAPGQHFQPPPLFDFALLNVHDLELDIRMQALLQRAQEQQPSRGGQVVVGDYLFMERSQRLMLRGQASLPVPVHASTPAPAAVAAHSFF